MKTHLLILLLAIVANLTFGQVESVNTPKISGNYQDTPFRKVVVDLERKYPIKFYYQEKWVDSVSVTTNFNDQPLDVFLKEAFRATDIYFHVDKHSNIILTKGHKLVSKIPDSYFRVGSYEDESNEVNEVPDQLFTQAATKSFSPNQDDKLEKSVIEIGDPKEKYNDTESTIDGYVLDENTGEPLIGASVFIKKLVIGVITDPFGYYSFTLPKGKHTLNFQFIGMKSTERKVLVHSDGRLNVEMKDGLVALKEVVITGERDNIEDIQTGLTKLTSKQLKIVPTVLGEADVLKITLTLPGVQSVGEGASGFNVRGGDVDQNLMLLNDATIYNPNHLFGFFSAFNSDVIQSADLYKSGFQAHYGGRVSSVFDVNIRDGNRKKFSAKGGISPVTAKVTLEGPIKKEESSFIIGFRSTYSDWMLKLLDSPSLRNSSGSFYDVIAKVVHKVNDKNSLTVSAYHSRDRFRLGSDTTYNYNNTSATLQWRHSFNNKLYSLASLSHSDYSFDVSDESNPVEAFKIGYQLNNWKLKYDFNYFHNSKLNMRFGISSNLYNLNPGFAEALGDESLLINVQVQKEKALESALHFGGELEVSPKLSIYSGLRASVYSFLGPKDVLTYQTGVTRDENFVIDTVSYDKGKFIKTYGGPEFRFSLRYKLLPTLSLKASYDNTRQYIHILTNSVAISPTDTWKLSDTYIKPKIGNQYTLGLYKKFSKTDLTLSLEGYYKRISNVLQYKSGADLILNETLETDVINGRAKSYGVEFMLRRNSGKLNGWLSYTYSRTFVQANGPFPGEQVNRGEFYPANYDKPHSLALVSNYKVNRRVNLSFNYTFSTGRPTTFPFTTYVFGGTNYPFFSDRNQFRVPDYHRLDIGANFDGNHRKEKRVHGSWSFSVYNLLGRRNVYSVFFESNGQEINAFKLSVFGNAIPSITYNFKF